MADREEAYIRERLVAGIRDFFTGVPGGRDVRACIALSGGIDSALVLALAVEALGRERVKVLMLPSKYSTEHSVDDSKEMIRRLRLPQEHCYLIPITAVFDAAMVALYPVLMHARDERSGGLAEENLQARIRMMMTMGLANAQGALMLNTSNRSEALVGYGTLYGDTGGAISVIGGLYKTQVYALSGYLNERGLVLESGEVVERPIPEHIMTKAPSAELRHGQKDSDSLPEYSILDEILTCLADRGMSVDEIVAEGRFGRDVVERVHTLMQGSEFKRRQLPPILHY